MTSNLSIQDFINDLKSGKLIVTPMTRFSALKQIEENLNLNPKHPISGNDQSLGLTAVILIAMAVYILLASFPHNIWPTWLPAWMTEPIPDLTGVLAGLFGWKTANLSLGGALLPLLVSVFVGLILRYLVIKTGSRDTRVEAGLDKLTFDTVQNLAGGHDVIWLPPGSLRPRGYSFLVDGVAVRRAYVGPKSSAIRFVWLQHGAVIALLGWLVLCSWLFFQTLGVTVGVAAIAILIYIPVGLFMRGTFIEQ